MNSFINFNQLNEKQLQQYNEAIGNAFPPVISESQTIIKLWSKLETYHAQYQHYLLSPEREILGFINTIPFHFDKSLNELPDEGWDWMLAKGLQDFENKKTPNYLGGLQVIVRKAHQKMGYSKKILNHCKQLVDTSNFSNLVIPLRPTKKHEFPSMPMKDYLKLQNQNKIFDPWVRVHLNGGADVIGICESSMTVEGDIKFWEKMFGRAINTSGEHILKGALSPIRIDIENDSGVYREPNVWIKYD